ncbi:glycolate oxidase subunit GlcE [Ramlibacter albus]|uniref:Glycolate oxidase subunit GlcE n=1 Tax=Ramlibacter albus TaxID=2079448 RepID=A0A923S131_9BURK|nr:glycolate oxidase subunit GlcE [Ramlibacter albus]MBC5763865.1 glycolate oxidase subunit GlcE [Ramlibacter albus]
MDDVLAQLIERIREAAGSGTPVRIRGGGSKDFYGERFDGEMLRTGALDRVIAYEPSELVVTVQAGMPLTELEALLAREGQCLPFEPPHFAGEPTVGGMVAAGLSGPARASVGSVRDYVLGITLVNGRGEQLRFGGTVMKNVAGYDVSRLMVGAMGTLGLIAEVSLKVLPVARAEATLQFQMTQAEALKHLNAWGGKPLPLNASCWTPDDAGTLMLRLRGAQAAVDAACKALGGQRQDNADAAKGWQRCRDMELPWFTDRGERDLWRLSVPQTAQPLGGPEPGVIEWHGGQRWLRADRSDASLVRELAQDAGGHATLFMPADLGGIPPQRFQPLPAALDHIHRELKRQFDPAGIFNPGRLYSDF